MADQESKVPTFNLPPNQRRFATLAEASKANRLVDAYLFSQSEKKALQQGKENQTESIDSILATLIRESRLQNQLGATMIRASKFEKALALFSQALMKFEKYQTLVMEKRLGDLKHGEQMFLENKIGFANLLYHMGSALASLKKPNEAAEYYLKAIAKSPFAHVIDYSKREKKDSILYKSASPKFNSLQALTQTYTNLGVMLMMIQKDIIKKEEKTDALLDTAQESFRRAIQLDPQNSQSHINLGNVLRQIGKKDQAIAHVWEQIKFEYISRNPEGEFKQPQSVIISSFQAPPIAKQAPQHLNVFCVKFGTKYGADYVNKLYNGVSRNLKSIPFTFYCLTEDAAGLDEGVKTIPLDTSLSGWWAKAHIFKAGTEYGIQGRVMYIDLDMIITGTLENMAKYTGDFALLSTEEIYCETAKEVGYNSSIILFPSSIGSYLYEVLQTWKEFLLKFIVRFDHFLQMMVKNAHFVQDVFPGEVCDYMFLKNKSKGEMEVPEEARVICFPRNPKPHECDDEWIRQYWI